MNKLNGILSTALLLLGGIVWLQHRHTIYLTEERDRFQMNNTALLSCMKRMQIDSTTMALETKVLRLTVDEYKEYRAEDAETIRRFGIKVKKLEAAARHKIEVRVPVDANIRDTLIIRDSILLHKSGKCTMRHIHAYQICLIIVITCIIGAKTRYCKC